MPSLRFAQTGLALLFLIGSLAFCDDLADLRESLAKRSDEGWSTARQIWELAEPGYQETRSAALLSGWLEREGFRVERGVAEIPTAFTATFGEGQPVIAILGEYDALPGLSQDAVPTRQPRAGTYGQGCGHHLFGVASLMAATAVADQIKAGRVKGTIRYYGCPAEEGGSAKVFMVRAGLFQDVAAVLHWHPSSMNSGGESNSLARIAVKFRFHGKSAHASSAPEEGRSALDGVELTAHAAELLREHIPTEARIHHVITQGGDAPNVVPAEAEIYFYIRHPKAIVVAGLYERLVKCAKGAALATETELEIVNEGGIVELLPNKVLGEVVLKHLKEQNDLKYSEDEIKFALKLQETFSHAESLDQIRDVTTRSSAGLGKGSTDVGDVSWVVPTAGCNVSCWVPGTPGHSWQAVACGGTTIARQGMNLAARTLALSAIEFYARPDLLIKAREELQKRLEGQKYLPLVPAEMKPPLDYRRTQGEK